MRIVSGSRPRRRRARFRRGLPCFRGPGLRNGVLPALQQHDGTYRCGTQGMRAVVSLSAFWARHRRYGPRPRYNARHVSPA